MIDRSRNFCTDLNGYIYVTTEKKIIVIDPRQNCRVISEFSCDDFNCDVFGRYDNSDFMYEGICVNDKVLLCVRQTQIFVEYST